MPWVIRNGVPVKSGLSPQEVTVAEEFDAATELTCPECGREYKTEAGLDRHISTKH